MKIVKCVLIQFAMLVLVNTTMANNFISSLKVEDNKFYLSLENASAQTSIRILDKKGFTWVEETVVNSGQFKKVFNLDPLPSGAYSLIIKSDIKETVQPITVTSEGLILDEKGRLEYFQASLIQQRQSVRLSLLNPTKSEVRIFVITNAGKILFQDAVKDEHVIDKYYNLKQLPAGNYTILIDNAHEVFSKTVHLH